ncbi:MAG: hypothetical protein HOF11_22615 [Rhodospirillaceae bacterium]|nr:hypothetical protein [Rhodospirillaceae bacterium]
MFFKSDVVALASWPGDTEKQIETLARLVDSWSTSGILEPEKRPQAGKGRHRIYTRLEAALFLIGATLHRCGINKTMALDQALLSIRSRHWAGFFLPPNTKKNYPAPERTEGPVDFALEYCAGTYPDPVKIELMMTGTLFQIEFDQAKFSDDAPVVIRLSLNEILKPLAEAIADA